jgi:hypothetical protein
MGLRIHVRVKQPSDHALILRVMLRSLGLEELDALLAQSEGYFYPVFAKR